MTHQKFDVFLAHNSLDKPLIRIISEELKRFEITAWLDEERILPGQHFQDSIQQAISCVRSAAICIGCSGLGRWQRMELRSFIARCVENEIPVIPVLLPGVRSIPDSNIFLKDVNWVSFEKGIDNEDAIFLLAQGIRQRDRSTSYSNSSHSAVVSANATFEDLEREKEVLESFQKKKEFVAQQLSEHISDFEKYVETIQNQRESVEKRLAEIKDRITRINSLLLKEKSESLITAVEWIRDNQKRLADSAIRYVATDGTDPNDYCYSRFRLRLRQSLEIIEHCLITDDKDIWGLVERLTIPPHYTELTPEAIRHMQKRISRQSFTLEVKEKIDLSIEQIISCLNTLKEDSQ